MPCAAATQATSSKIFTACTKVRVFVRNVMQCLLHLVSRCNFMLKMNSYHRRLNCLLTCLTAEDTFNHITLEIPRMSKLNFVIVLVRDHGEQEPALPVKYCVSIPENGTVDDVIAVLSSMSGVPASRLKLSSVLIDKCNITQLHRYDW
jgi:hypothetical protein